MERKGINGTVEFDGSFVTIKRTGDMARVTIGRVTSESPSVR
jgi:hypothetical protein